MYVCVLERAKHNFFALPNPLSCSVMNKICLNQALRPEMLIKLRTGLMVVTKTLLIAQPSMWYPRITVDIKNMIRQCNPCQVHKNV